MTSRRDLSPQLRHCVTGEARREVEETVDLNVTSEHRRFLMSQLTITRRLRIIDYSRQFICC